LRPRNFWFITIATASGITISSGTLNSVKMPVACMEFQNGSNATESGSRKLV
jgi:hypothetical protein